MLASLWIKKKVTEELKHVLALVYKQSWLKVKCYF